MTVQQNQEPVSMIERVARALCVELGEDPDQQTPFHPRISYLWQHYIKAARAAIEAMREPTEKMRAAMNDGIDWDGDAVRAYLAGIDAALKEQP